MFKRLFIALLLPACIGKSDYQGDSTPDGWHIQWHEQGTVEAGYHTLAEIYSIFDSAPWRACQTFANSHSPYTPEYVWNDMKKKQKTFDFQFQLIDNFWFPVGRGEAVDFPNATAAAGLNTGAGNITISFYTEHDGTVDRSSVPLVYPAGPTVPWTPVYGLNEISKWMRGQDDTGNEFPALAYEIGHNYGY